jgi:GNAT superfamily N-acetyltransferase
LHQAVAIGRSVKHRFAAVAWKRPRSGVEIHDDSTGTAVRLARPDEGPRLAQILATAFESDPVLRWFIAGDDRWSRSAVRMFLWYTARRIRHGTAYVTGDLRGVALWDSPDHVHMTLTEQLSEAAMATRVFGTTILRADRGNRLLKSHHPPVAHWYLHVVGVDAQSRGRGIGASLLRPVLARCDQEGTAAYLEATSLRNVPLYERQGFEVAKEVRLPKGPPYFAMVRSPQR